MPDALDALQRWAPDGRYVLGPTRALRAQVAGSPSARSAEAPSQVAATRAALVAKGAEAAG